MAYARPDRYPDGELIPRSLPPAYQPAINAEVPQGQRCSNCGYFNPVTDKCSRWNNVVVKPSYWCRAWEKNNEN
jgi:hypothetical protein